MLKVYSHRLALIAAPVLMAVASPALALTSAEIAAFEAEIGEAKSKMMGQSASALEHARKARGMVAGEGLDAQKARLTAQWLEGEALMRLNRADEAEATISAAVKEISINFSGSKLHADLLRSDANIKARKSNYVDALATFLQAHDLYAELGEDRSRAIVLQNIGSLYSKARDFEKALGYYRQASEAFPSDPSLSLSAHNNTGNALKGLGRFAEAESAFAEALELARQKGSPLLEARILTNIASVQVLDGDAAKAEQTAAAAMTIAQEHAPGWVRFIDGVMAQIELSKGNLDQAKAHLEQAFAGEDLAKTAAHFREFHETAAQVFTQSGDDAQAEPHRQALDRLDAQVAKLSE